MEDKEKSFNGKRWVPALIIALLLVLIGISVAWFAYLNRLNTISVVQIPSRITISGANRSEMQKISLEMTSDDTQVENRVTIRRVFCIESTDDFLLEVAHTTNIPSMEIKIFPVSNENSKPEKKSGAVTGSDAGKTFYYDPDGEEIAGDYINKEGNIAIQENDSDPRNLHGKTYSDGDTGKVQQNAEPLYWLSDDVEEFDKENYSRVGKAGDGVTEIHYRYYVLELSWNIDRAETDMVYLLASHKD
ncbi:hypothetical protein [Sporofaciens sp. SGI.106]|uniref:hypothetical protein n=1 Tax=Sporofaciens sp. SGI.106 TaxID=3420568 RepID=UPI003CFC9B52